MKDADVKAEDQLTSTLIISVQSLTNCYQQQKNDCLPLMVAGTLFSNNDYNDDEVIKDQLLSRATTTHHFLREIWKLFSNTRTNLKKKMATYHFYLSTIN